MKRDFVVFLLISFFTLLFWRGAFFNFFAQDDFIFIKHFSQNSLLIDIENSFGKPEVTHWRPLHNLYFLISGNLFGKNYYLYHGLTLAMHIASSFLIYKLVGKFWTSFRIAFSSSLIYAIHPAHFVAMYWISGSAVNIGFFFLLLALYLYLNGRKVLGILLFPLALAASEAMIAGIGLFALVLSLEKLRAEKRYLVTLILSTVVFFIVKLLFTASATFDIYQLEVSAATIAAFRYYILRTLGFAETSGDLFVSILLGVFLTVVLLRVLSYVARERKKLIFPLATLAGFFPFVLLPNHLSPHYMVLPILGFSQFLSWGLSKYGRLLMIVGFLIFALISFLNINKTAQNNWVVDRSDIARKYLQNLESKNLASGSALVFGDGMISSSKEAYIALGEGSAIDLWFTDKNYKKCFTFSENCPQASDSF